MRKVLLLMLLSLILIPISVSAVCTVTFDKETYAPTETITAEMVCDEQIEKNQLYDLYWRNQTNDVLLETDSGTTPSVAGTYFYQSYTIPAGVSNGTVINATLTGTQLEGTDNATILTAGASQLLITNITQRGKFIGRSSSVEAIVKDSDGIEISGAMCHVHILSNDGDAVITTTHERAISGRIDVSYLMTYEEFDEGVDYLITVHCYCGSTTSSTECINENGISVENAVGSSSYPYTTSTWLTFNEDPMPTVYVNGTDKIGATVFAGLDYIYWRENVSSNYIDKITIGVTSYLISNSTDQIYNHIQTEGVRTLDYGNRTGIFHLSTSLDAFTGIYKIRSFYRVSYKGIQVAQYAVESEPFNITGIQDTLVISDVEVRDYWDNIVNSSTALQDSDDIPASNWTNPFYLLSEGFTYQVCSILNNTYDDDITFYLDHLVLQNPTTGESLTMVEKDQQWNRLLIPGTSELCYKGNFPQDISTHSDYNFVFNIRIGSSEREFVCDDECDFTGSTDYFYIGAIEDMLSFNKWYAQPNETAYGDPLIYVVTEGEEYLTMNDDCNYTTQETTDWGNASFVCADKDDGSLKLLDLSKYPRVGEKMKVCFEVYNYFAEEINVEIYDIYMDSDLGETVERLSFVYTEGYFSSNHDPDMYIPATPSRAQELGGDLHDGYGIMCTEWFDLPYDIQGGNNWDVQGKVRINSDFYDLTTNLEWQWESDEFPIYGRRNDELYTRLIDVKNITTSAYDTNISSFTQLDVIITYDFYGRLEEEVYTAIYCFENTDSDKIERCIERTVEPETGTDATISDSFILPNFEENGWAEVSVQFFDRFGELIGYADVEPWNTFYVTNLNITNITTDRYGQNISSLSDIDVTITYDFFGLGEETYMIEYCFEDTDEDYIAGCFENIVNPDVGEDNQITQTIELPWFESNGNAEVSVRVYTDDEDKVLVASGDTEPQNTFYVYNLNITNLTTSAYGSTLNGCEQFSFTITYDYYGDQLKDYVLELCFMYQNPDYAVRCYDTIVQAQVGDQTQVSALFTAPYFEFSSPMKMIAHVHDIQHGPFHSHDPPTFPYGSTSHGRLLSIFDDSNYNTFNATVNSTQACQYSSTDEMELLYIQSSSISSISQDTPYLQNLTYMEYSEYLANQSTYLDNLQYLTNLSSLPSIDSRMQYLSNLSELVNHTGYLVQFQQQQMLILNLTCKECYNYTEYYFTMANNSDYMVAYMEGLDNLTVSFAQLAALSTFAEVRYVGGTEYASGETGEVAYQFLYTDAGNPIPINNATCNVTIYYPNMTQFFFDDNMTYIPGTSGVYYSNFTIPEVEGVYTTDTVCNSSDLVGYGSATFHVAIWANEIFRIEDYIVLAGTSTYRQLRSFILAEGTGGSNMNVNNMTCLDNQTLRVITQSVTNTTGNITDSTNILKYQDYYCQFGCNQATNMCNMGYALDVWMFLVLSVISFYLMFGRRDPIINMIGSLMIFVLGGYVAIAGIDFVTDLSLVGTVGGSTVVDNYITMLIGLVYIGLAIYRVASSWSRFNADKAPNQIR